MRYGVILAGGGGSRLWPASRQARPKQLLPLTGSGRSLLAAAHERAATASDEVMVVCGRDHAAAAAEQAPGADIVAEPTGRNTAAAIGLAAVHLFARDPDAVLGILPADHAIADTGAFADLAGRAYRLADQSGQLVTLGIVPTRPETGYGYIRLGSAGQGGSHEVERFVEKPSAELAEAIWQDGRHLWNAGMFFATARCLLDQLARHLPDLYRGLDTIARAIGTSDAERVTGEVYQTLEPISIDYGVLERASDLLCMPATLDWSDVGSWSAIGDICPADPSGNVRIGCALTIDSHRNVTVADPDCVVALVGVDDLVVVQSGNAVLVVPKSRAQDVRQVIDELRKQGLEHYL